MTIQDRIGAYIGGTPPESTPALAEAEAPSSQENDENTEAPKGETEVLNRRRTLKLDGREIEIEILSDDQADIDLVPGGLLKDADYTKKTMAAAEVNKAATKQLEKYREKVADLEAALTLDIENLDSPEMQELRQYDPDTYLKKFEAAKKKEAKLEKAKNDLYERDSKALKDKAKKEIDLWVKSVPAWLDESVKTKDIKLIAETLQESGFSEQEMGDMYDHRLIKILHESALYRQIKSQKIQPKAAKPKPSRPMGANSTASAIDSTEYAKTREKLRQTGSRADAQAAIKQFLSGG